MEPVTISRDAYFALQVFAALGIICMIFLCVVGAMALGGEI
jgi:hypothetical protein